MNLNIVVEAAKEKHNEIHMLKKSRTTLNDRYLLGAFKSRMHMVAYINL